MNSSEDHAKQKGFHVTWKEGESDQRRLLKPSEDGSS